MSNLILTRKAGQSVRLMIGDRPEYLDILEVTGGFCKVRVLSTLQVERVRFRGDLQIGAGITITVLDLAKGHAKLGFTAPRDVQILRTELIKEDI